MNSTFDLTRADFPPDFLFGVATSAYQIEGSNFGGCGQSHWDTFAATPGNTKNAENGSIACDHYHRYQTDFDLIADANLDHYRFSVSWARVLPEPGKINEEGLDFYDRLTDALLGREIKPMLTLHHWELPSWLADIGGWRNRDIASHFAEFTDTITKRIGSRMWASGTFNEPWCVTWLSHFHGIHAPGLRDIRATARAVHHVLLAHSKSIEAMRSNGMDNLGVYLNFEPSYPASDSAEDIAASARHNAQYNECFLHPLFKGNYPDQVLEGIERYLPANWQNDMALISSATLDWLGINNYTRTITADAPDQPWPSVRAVEGPLPKTEMGWEIAPENFGDLLRWVAREYTGDLPLYVTENGMAGPEQITDNACNDPERIEFLSAHIAEMQKAMNDGVPINGYTVWSLLDNFEWERGYDKRFGLVHVDYETLERTPKSSWYALKNALARTKTVP
ncbi:MAG: GH1 family beta-glucosidase [Pseudomonadota bacterium]